MTTPSIRRTTTIAETVGAVTATLFVVLGLISHHARAGTAFDHTVLTDLIAHRTPALTTVATAITTVFDPMGTLLLALASAIALWIWLRSVQSALLVPATLVVATTISTFTKHLVGAHRPPAAVQLITETDPSFPSGHVTGTVALFGAVAVVVGYHRGRLTRIVLIAVTVIAGVTVAATRLYLGVHWTTDVLGGGALATTVVMIALIAYLRAFGPPTAPYDDAPTTVLAAQSTLRPHP
ncbi:phosphatase PAP2 family protein [Millisia brevis]|uniref:phosphatase PAP2 family protein n=1 Tax=Millisia brevis TaxID=264148 RepID=UPI0008318392|nr:phosphatase PAP2 family protein [Millisia brevis]